MFKRFRNFRQRAAAIDWQPLQGGLIVSFFGALFSTLIPIFTEDGSFLIIPLSIVGLALLAFPVRCLWLPDEKEVALAARGHEVWRMASNLGGFELDEAHAMLKDSRRMLGERKFSSERYEQQLALAEWMVKAYQAKQGLESELKDAEKYADSNSTLVTDTIATSIKNVQDEIIDAKDKMKALGQLIFAETQVAATSLPDKPHVEILASKEEADVLRKAMVDIEERSVKPYLSLR